MLAAAWTSGKMWACSRSYSITDSLCDPGQVGEPLKGPGLPCPHPTTYAQNRMLSLFILLNGDDF